MSSLPDRPDLRQLRTRAKELKRAFEAGDQEAIARSSPRIRSSQTAPPNGSRGGG